MDDAPIHFVRKSAGIERSGTWPIVISRERTRSSRTWYLRKKCFERAGTAAPDATRWLAVLSVPMNVGLSCGTPKARSISRTYEICSAILDVAML